MAGAIHFGRGVASIPDVSRGTVNQDVSGTDAAPESPESPTRQFVVVTKDFSGLGWAKKLQEEGETVTLALESPETKKADQRLFDQVAAGWIPTMSLTAAMTALVTPSTYWIFAENNFPDEADALRAKGQKVFGTSALSEKMEHDRHYAIEIAAQCGLASPETEEFASRQEGLAFLDAHPDTAYVFKPDESAQNFATFVPVREQDADANRETFTYLDHMQQEPGSYILQERVQGTEVDVEVWFFEGEPFFAFATLEAKRKNPHDLGEMSGCAGDFAWVVPLDSPLVQETIGPMLDFYREQRYTGFADVNVILTNQGPLFLEVCNRFGYNGHVTLFLALAQDTFGNILADFMDGNVANMADRFSPTVGSSITLFLDHPREGLPIHLDPRWVTKFYPFDGYLEEGTLLLSGYSHEVGIFVDQGPTIEAAAQACLDKLLTEEAVSIPESYWRTDLGASDYPNAPALRFQALQQMGLA